jgi:hypothetical protein
VKMPPVRIEGEAWGDPKFPHLARLLGLPDGPCAIIKVAIIWAWQTENYTPEAPCFVVSAWVIEMALGEAGPAAMVRAGLAEERPDGYFIVGSNDERTGWLYRSRSKGTKGGKASAAAKRERKPRNKSSTRVEPGLSTGSAQVDPLLSSLSSPVLPLGEPKIATSPVAASKPQHRPAIDAFDRLYREASEGSKPTWDGQTVGMVKKLVEKHGVDEVVLRIGRLFDGWIPWMAGVPDVKTLVGHFDKLVGSRPANARAGPAPPQLRGAMAALSLIDDERSST